MSDDESTTTRRTRTVVPRSSSRPDTFFASTSFDETFGDVNEFRTPWAEMGAGHRIPNTEEFIARRWGYFCTGRILLRLAEG